jgi:hypothetical protein
VKEFALKTSHMNDKLLGIFNTHLKLLPRKAFDNIEVN